MTHAWTVVAYTYKADIYCDDCIVEQIDGEAPVSGFYAESKLDYIAGMVGVDRQNESSFDSDDFPKVVFADSIDGTETCGACGGEIA